MSSFKIHNNAITPDMIKNLLGKPNSKVPYPLKRSESSFCTKIPEEEETNKKPNDQQNFSKGKKRDREIIIACPKTIKKQKIFKLKNFLNNFRGKKQVNPNKIKFNMKLVELKRQNHQLNLKIQQRFSRLDLFIEKIHLVLDQKL